MRDEEFRLPPLPIFAKDDVVADALRRFVSLDKSATGNMVYIWLNVLTYTPDLKFLEFMSSIHYFGMDSIIHYS